MSTANLNRLDQEPPTGRTVPKVASEQIMRGQREIVIQHGPEEYRLRITAMGKLILTK
ncbi:MAG: hemin uptake protein HemP [Alphaproteobacteria bacterium]|nr:hemin uptake protein HemP [Alphaproteobacteria bacterium]